MDKVLQQAVTPGELGEWLLLAFLVVFFIYKEWPDFKKRVSGSAVKEATEKSEKEATDKSVNERLTAIEETVRQIEEKLDRDYGRINEMERWKKSIEQIAAESLEEREILMQAMLGVLGGLQQLGANGPTEEATDTIHRYINKQAHKRGEDR